MYYDTTDIQVAAALMAVGHKLQDVFVQKGERSRRGTFRFTDCQELRDDLLDYHNDRLAYPARVLFGRLRELKSQALNL